MNKQTLLLTLLGILIIGVLVPNTPLCRKIPSRDSGVFLYIGEQILDGKILYRDVWDHKPPVIHYINALGLFIGRGSTWGVLFLEFLSLYMAGLLGFVLLKRVFWIVPAIFGTVVWLTNLILVLGGGNFTEEFALPFQFAALYLFWLSEKRGSYSWRGFLIGVTASISFLLRPNLIGVQLSILVFLLLTRISSRHWRDLFSSLAAIFLGATSIILVVVVQFGLYKALGSFWDATFNYNFAYSTATLESRIESLRIGLLATSYSGMSILVLLAWFAGVFYVWRGRDKAKDRKALLCVSLIGLLVEFLLVAFSGRSYCHYYIAWLPVSAILAGFFAHISTTGLSFRLKETCQVSKSKSVYILLCVIFLVMSYVPVLFLIDQVSVSGDERGNAGYQAVQYIERVTTESNYVLLWGAETSVNFVTHRRSPTRFVYQYPLYTRGYQNTAMIEEFLDDIVVNKPTLIIDTSPSNGHIPPIDSVERERWTPTDEHYGVLPEMDKVFEYIASNYEMAERVGREQWLIYRYAGKQ